MGTSVETTIAGLDAPGLDPAEVAAELCALLEQPLGLSLSVVAARLGPVVGRWMAVVGIMRARTGHATVGAATAIHADPRNAVARATLAAVTDNGLLDAAARRAVELGAAEAGVVLEGGSMRVVAGDEARAEQLAALYDILPSDGWLSVGTAERGYRALRTPWGGMVLATAAEAGDQLEHFATTLEAVFDRVPAAAVA